MQKIIKYLFNPMLLSRKLYYKFKRIFKVRKIKINGDLFYKYKGELYPEYLSNGNAVSYIADFAKEHCRGKGLDIGSSKWPLEGSIAVENDKELNAFKLDLFENNSLDYIFSSHCLEHIENWQDALSLWIKKIKEGGIIFLYLPHQSMGLWSPGGPWVEDEHKWAPSYQVINGFLESKGLDIIDYNNSKDKYYSFYIIAKK